MTTVDEALARTRRNDLQQRLVHHLADRPGFSTTERLVSELYGYRGAATVTSEQRGWVTNAMRALQRIGFVRYDSQYGGWIR